MFQGIGKSTNAQRLYVIKMTRSILQEVLNDQREREREMCFRETLSKFPSCRSLGEKKDVFNGI